ncbi:MAG: glycosyltransferase family A protein [Lactobacillus sp.]|uniref:Glycosyltransferase family 2 protein n=1 Tax=Lactobacillus porci TaxID=2012477 RepID=A0A6A8MDV0_9LACO|nr:glycosyltransferase family A protein [Lactobacillus porci]MST86963.1 glycosyltransferase family 2 protein [Lactobacillus porci]
MSQTGEPELTVIMTVYNQEKYIARALDHLLAQSNRNFKLLIIDDGSTDQTVAIAQKYAARFRCFKLVVKENKGVAAARNLGLDLVDTPYFIFHDGDDWVDPAYTDYFIKQFSEHPEWDYIACGYYLDSEKITAKPIAPKAAAGMLTKLQGLRKILGTITSSVRGYSWNKCYKTSLVRQYDIRFNEELDLMEDQVFNVDYLTKVRNFYFNTIPLYHYWQRPDSAVHTVSWSHSMSIVRANCLMLSIVVKNSWHNWRKSHEIRQIHPKREYSRKFLSEGIKDDHQS